MNEWIRKVEELEKQNKKLLEVCKLFVSACETAPPIELIKYIDIACNQAKAAISKAEKD